MPVLDIDGNGAVDPLTDGLLIIRYLSGVRGAALISGAVGVGATRTTAATIEGYIEYIYPRLDVDGNGEVALHSDGLMILLRMFTFSDNGLITADDKYIVEPGARRVTADEIEAYIDELSV